MHWNLIVPLGLGVVAVAQATLNKTIAQTTGLAAATILNMTVAMACGVAFAVVCLQRAQPSGFLRWNPEFGAMRWWWLVPGLAGFAIVLGLPWAVARVGALSTFVALVAAQMVASAVWDRFDAGIPLSSSRVLGAGFTVLGVWLISRPVAP